MSSIRSTMNGKDDEPKQNRLKDIKVLSRPLEWQHNQAIGETFKFVKDKLPKIKEDVQFLIQTLQKAFNNLICEQLDHLGVDNQC